MQTYDEFLQAKTCVASGSGFDCELDEINPWCKPHTKATIQWCVRGGRRAIFSAFGLHKTVTQLEVIRIILEKLDKQPLAANAGIDRGLIVAPLGVRQEFFRDAEKLGIQLRFIRRTEEADRQGIYLTNYESIREGKLDPRIFKVVSLDEAGILRGFGGTKTFREFMKYFEGSGKYRFVATATPSPNEYIELLAYAAFLDIMDVAGAKTRFFKRDSTKADKLTIHPHKEKEFWLWCASWGLFLQKPSDIGFSDEGYELPPLDIHWHEIASDHKDAGIEKSGQRRLIANAAIGVSTAAREKRSSLDARIAKLIEIRSAAPEAHRIIWHDLETERQALEAAIPTIKTVYGSQDLIERERYIVDFADGLIQEIGGKPVMLGQGVNFQRHCAEAIFLGIGWKFNDFVQAVHRIQRFGQTKKCVIHLIYTEAERQIRHDLERKWAQHKELVANMTRIIREYGLASESLKSALGRSLGCERREEKTDRWTMVNNDCVYECERMEPNCVDLILTSIPFSTQYEYSPSYNDFGHTDDEKHFFKQMDFLVPGLLKVLRPGRVAVIHVKDRVTPGGITGLGFQTVSRFADHTCDCFEKHGFAFIGRKTIVTDVVRENSQTYRLGWTEQCKDGSRMGVGMPEYLLFFRKPPTDASNGYADLPVTKSKDKYSRARWQFDAHGFARSSGNRLLTTGDLKGATHAEIFKLFKKHSLENVYNFEHDVKIAEHLDKVGMLPPSFMLLQPQSWHPDVWTDVTRMRTLNGVQEAKGKEMHLCPMQFDTADRVINQFSMPDEIVFDPFAGLGTVPLRAVALGRRGLGVELAPNYYADACWHLRVGDQKRNSPMLFDLEDDLDGGSPAPEAQNTPASVPAVESDKKRKIVGYVKGVMDRDFKSVEAKSDA